MRWFTQSHGRSKCERWGPGAVVYTAACQLKVASWCVAHTASCQVKVLKVGPWCVVYTAACQVRE